MTFFDDKPLLRCWQGVCLMALVTAGPGLASDNARSQTEGFFAGMTARERHETGLDQLNARQRQALNDWLAKRFGPLNNKTATGTNSLDANMEAEVQKRVAEKLARQRTEGLGREKTQERHSVSARIAGAFKGWRGATEFTLDNGQVWRQTDGETYYIRTMHNPEVELVPMALGSWGLRLKATGRTVKVRRIR